MSTHSAQQFLHAVPSAQSRVLIDMVNGLDVARDHIRVSKVTEGSVLARFMGSITGETQQRNNRIAQNQQLVLESAVQTITVLAKGLARSNFAITQVANRLTEVESSLAQAVNVLIDTREAVQQLRSTVDAQVERLNAEVARLDLRVAASEQLENVMSCWEAGKFDAFPMASRCFISLHELYWGEFGEYLRQHSNAGNVNTLLETLQNKLLARLKYGAAGEDALPLSQWLKASAKSDENAEFFQQGLAYLGDSCSALAKPWSYTLTQLPKASQAPKLVSQYCNASTIAQRVSREFFPVLKGVAYV